MKYLFIIITIFSLLENVFPQSSSNDKEIIKKRNVEYEVISFLMITDRENGYETSYVDTSQITKYDQKGNIVAVYDYNIYGFVDSTKYDYKENQLLNVETYYAGMLNRYEKSRYSYNERNQISEVNTYEILKDSNYTQLIKTEQYQYHGDSLLLKIITNNEGLIDTLVTTYKDSLYYSVEMKYSKDGTLKSKNYYIDNDWVMSYIHSSYIEEAIQIATKFNRKGQDKEIKYYNKDKEFIRKTNYKYRRGLVKSCISDVYEFQYSYKKFE